MWVIICLAALWFGCGDNLGDPAEGSSGSRLRIERYVFEDGTRVRAPTELFDAERGEHCAPRRWSDANTYCTPATGELVYLDSGCTAAIGVAAAHTHPQYFVSYFRLNNVSSPSRLFPPGAQIDTPAQYWQLVGDACSGPIPGTASYDYYTPGPALASASFARLRRSDPVGGGRLQIVRYTSDDGLDVPLAIHDRVLDAECALPDPHDRSAAPCEPVETIRAVYFRDAECGALAISTANDEQIISDPSDVTGCTGYFARGSDITGQLLYDRGTACTVTSPPPSERQFAAGPSIELASVTRTQRARAGARLLKIERAADRLQGVDDLLFDTAIGADCEVIDLGGQPRCIPIAHAEVRTYFSDDLCRVPIALAFAPSGSCDVPSLFAGTGSTIFRVLDRYRQTIYEVSTGDRCVPYVPPARFTPFEIGPLVPLETFAPATLYAD